MDITPLKDAMTQLPKQIYDIVKQHEHILVVTAKATDDLICNISKTYYHAVIESLCKLIRSVQQGQRTSLVSMAQLIKGQNEIIEHYQGLTELPDQMAKMQNQVQKQVNQIKGHTCSWT